MLRRQALGTITNSTNNQSNGAAFNSKTTASFKQSASANNLLFNDENASSLPASKATIDEFEIFSEEQVQLKNSNAATIANKPVIVGGTSGVKSNKENFLFKSEEDEEDEEEEDNEEDEEESEENSSSSDEDSDEEDDDDDDDEENVGDCEERLEQEEEGISRLNLAANVSSLEQMMDSTMSTNFTASPMVLDDTIKFISKLDVLSDKEEESYSYFDEEEDAETKKKMEAENILFNFIDYKDDCLKYMRKLEQELRPKPGYMKKQMDITNSMRSILIDWLVEVAEEYKLNVETLHLAVNFTDRFLSQMSVLRAKLQLVGTASMYIASKYEEITPPDVSEFVYITDDTYNRKQVLRMEHLLLKTLDFRVSQPTSNWFLSHYLKFLKLNTNLSQGSHSDLFQRIEYLSRYLSELTLLNSETFLEYLPSQIAASAVYLAMYTLNKPWTKQTADLLGYAYDLSELKGCIVDMFKFYQQASTFPQQAIQEKYKQGKYEHVALIDPPKSLPFQFNNTSLVNSA